MTRKRNSYVFAEIRWITQHSYLKSQTNSHIAVIENKMGIAVRVDVYDTTGTHHTIAVSQKRFPKTI